MNDTLQQSISGNDVCNITIDWLVNQSQISDIEYIAGNRGGNNTIQCVNIMDNPDTVRWLKGGELVLTTGYLFIEPSELRSNLIQQLYERGCAGLGIKLHRYLDELPQEMLDQAEEYGFPIIKIPLERTLSEIGKAIYSQLFKTQLLETEQSVLMYRLLLDIVVKSPDIHSFAEKTSQIMCNPVFIADGDLKMIVCKKLNDSIIDSECIISTVEGSRIFSREKTEYVLNEYRRRKYELITVPLSKLNDRQIECMLLPVLDSNSLIGFLGIIDAESSITSKEYNFATSILPILSIELMKFNLHKHGRMNFKNDFLNTVLLNNSLNDSEVKSLCTMYGFDYRKNRLCLAFRLDGMINPAPERRAAVKQHMIGAIEATFDHSEAECFRIEYNNSYVIFLLFNSKSRDKYYMTEYAVSYAEEIVDKLAADNIGCAVGVSSCKQGSDTITLTFMQALDALKIGSKIHVNDHVFSYEKDEIYHLFHSAFSDSQLKELYDNSLKALVSFDNHNKTELMSTIQVYFDCNLNSTEAAKKLFIHRNTMNYRLDKIREVLHSDLQNLDDCMRIQFGLYAMRLLSLNEHSQYDDEEL